MSFFSSGIRTSHSHIDTSFIDKNQIFKTNFSNGCPILASQFLYSFRFCFVSMKSLFFLVSSNLCKRGCTGRKCGTARLKKMS